MKAILTATWSPPSRRRGLKHRLVEGRTGGLVASLAEAWIETRYGIQGALGRSVASLAEAWIETRL